jgi:YD repeat-containing protein
MLFLDEDNLINQFGADLASEFAGFFYRDAFGNRLTKTDNEGTVIYEYDANDRLIRETGPAGVTTYEYDDNGNRLRKAGPGDTETYGYDAQNKLLSVQNAAHDIQYTYDYSGLRISQNVDGVVTNYLYDKNLKTARVLEELSGVGTLQARYVWGDTLDPILMSRAAVYSFYLADGNLNVRQLADETAQVFHGIQGKGGSGSD